MIIYFIFIFAFLIRLINLDQSLWLDETIVAKVVKTIPFHLIPLQFSPGDFHPPLYYLFISLWSSILGTSEIALRFPSILFSLLTGFFIYKIGLLWKNKQLALWAPLFFLFNPLIVYYSQEARMYMMATMFLTMALYYFLRLSLQKITTTTSWIHNDTFLFNLFSALSLFTFYGSAFFIAGMIVVWGINIYIKKRKSLDWIPAFAGMTKESIRLMWGLLFSLLFLSPLLYQQIMNARVGLADVKNWSMVLGKAELKNVAMVFLKFATGRISWFPKWSYYMIAGIPTALVWLSVVIGMKKHKLFAYLFILPLLFGLFISFWAPMMMYFRFLYLIPVMSLLLALTKNGKIKYMILLTYISFSFVTLFLPQFHREDWKKLTTSLSSSSRVYMILPSSDPIIYYRNDLPVYELRDIERTSLPEFISVIPYTSAIYGFDYQKVLEDKGCLKKTEMHFRGDLSVEDWVCLKKA